jgi:hypothetical protein
MRKQRTKLIYFRFNSIIVNVEYNNQAKMEQNKMLNKVNNRHFTQRAPLKKKIAFLK